MIRPLLSGLAMTAVVCAQSLVVVDRGLGEKSPLGQPVERAAGGFLGDSFRIGAEGETWMIDAIRVWAIPTAAASCPIRLGDQFEKITLLGALDNPPVPGQPVCDCHALVAIATAPLTPGSDASANPNVKLTPEQGIWRVDFQQVRWSVPGAADVLFSLRAAERHPGACHAAAGWKMAAGAVPGDHRLHLLDKAGVPAGPAGPQSPPRAIHVQVWAHRTQP